LTKKEHTKDFYSFFCSVPNSLNLLKVIVLLSQQQYQEQQDNFHFISKVHFQITVPIITMAFMIFNLDKGALNNLMIVMRKLVLIGLVQL
jgi:hypothetical protein